MAGKARNETLKIESLVLDPFFQMREIPLNEDHVADLHEAIEAKAGCLPRIKVIEVEGVGMVVTDGYHTIAAHKRAGMKMIGAEVKKGSLLDATVSAAKANYEHLGLKRTPADKRLAVNRLLDRLEEAKQDWSDARIADEIHVSRHLVKTVRNSRPDKAEPEEEIPIPQEARDGRKLKPKEKAKEKVKPIAGVDAGGWESTPIDEFLDADPFVMQGLKRSNVKTAGELYNRILANEKFGLQIDDVERLKADCEKLKGAEPAKERKAPEKQVGQQVGFDWNRFDAAFRIVAQSPDEIGNAYQGEQHAAERADCLRHLNNFKITFDRWKKRIQGV